jgi:hypothetical protein
MARPRRRPRPAGRAGRAAERPRRRRHLVGRPRRHAARVGAALAAARREDHRHGGLPERLRAPYARSGADGRCSPAAPRSVASLAPASSPPPRDAIARALCAPRAHSGFVRRFQAASRADLRGMRRSRGRLRLARRQKMPICRGFDGSDGTRTRDLRCDRPRPRGEQARLREGGRAHGSWVPGAPPSGPMRDLDRAFTARCGMEVAWGRASRRSS